eukprot:3908053-Ditylum_brightwellii.AAC.1
MSLNNSWYNVLKKRNINIREFCCARDDGCLWAHSFKKIKQHILVAVPWLDVKVASRFCKGGAYKYALQDRTALLDNGCWSTISSICRWTKYSMGGV